MRWFYLLVVSLTVGLSPCVCAEEQGFVRGKTLRVGVECLERMHLTHQPVDGSMSARWFREFLDELDPKRMYFLEADEDEFRSFEKRLGELAKAGDFSFPRQVRQRYETRVTQAAAHAEHWLSHPHDYSLNEVYPIQFEDYSGDNSELRDRWRLRIKFELLIEKVHGVAGEKTEAQLRSRYERIARDSRAMTDEQRVRTRFYVVVFRDRDWLMRLYWHHMASQRLDLAYVRRLRMCCPPQRLQRMPLRHRRVLTTLLQAASTGPLPIGQPLRRNRA